MMSLTDSLITRALQTHVLIQHNDRLGLHTFVGCACREIPNCVTVPQTNHLFILAAAAL